MTSDFAVNVDKRLPRVLDEVDWGQGALVTVTLEVIEAFPILIEGFGSEQEAFDLNCTAVQPDRG